MPDAEHVRSRPGRVRDDGAGVHKTSGPLWAHGDVLADMVSELDEIRDKITNAQMEAICTVMLESLHKATHVGGESASLAAMRQISKVPEYHASAMLARGGGQAAGPSSNPRSPKPAKGPKASGAASPSKGKRPAGAASPAATAAKAAKAPKYPDDDGAIGPNGLARMAGGNPAGEKCSRFAKGACTFKFCSYSH